nr:hypothetical protein [Ardenticatena sp.]
MTDLLMPLFTAFAWFALTFVIVAGIGILSMPVVLGKAQMALRQRPPRGPEWAHRVWYERQRVYGLIFATATLAGLLVALSHLL